MQIWCYMGGYGFYYSPGTAAPTSNHNKNDPVNSQNDLR